VTDSERMIALVWSFPSLAGYQPSHSMTAGVDVFDPVAFEQWARGPWATGGSIRAARFILEVWNGGERAKANKLVCGWKLGPFSFKEAMCTWDSAHRRAFLAFCEKPFWP